ncbi:carbon-nitrogen hydrolase family protein [Candidatus Omnitrophota bacterium]
MKHELLSSKITFTALSLSTLDGMVDENYSRALRLCEIALAGKPDIILLPEAFAAGYCATDLTPFAEPRDSNHIERFRALSDAGGVMIILGFLEKCGEGIKNAAIVFDRGFEIGIHYKKNLWPDKKRPYRDELSLMVPGTGMEVFDTRYGKFSLFICYENKFDENWEQAASQADFIISPYNCEVDPAKNNIDGAKKFGLLSVWADRTGTVWAGDSFKPNMGTAGIVDHEGNIIAYSQAGVEEIVNGSLYI